MLKKYLDTSWLTSGSWVINEFSCDSNELLLCGPLTEQCENSGLLISAVIAESNIFFDVSINVMSGPAFFFEICSNCWVIVKIDRISSAIECSRKFTRVCKWSTRELISASGFGNRSASKLTDIAIMKK